MSTVIWIVPVRSRLCYSDSTCRLIIFSPFDKLQVNFLWDWYSFIHSFIHVCLDFYWKFSFSTMQCGSLWFARVRDECFHIRVPLSYTLRRVSHSDNADRQSGTEILFTLINARNTMSLFRRSANETHPLEIHLRFQKRLRRRNRNSDSIASSPEKTHCTSYKIKSILLFASSA